jgi:hypothetical protein
MGGPTEQFEEGEDSVLDSLTREELEQAAEDYDENKQVSRMSRGCRKSLHIFKIYEQDQRPYYLNLSILKFR